MTRKDYKTIAAALNKSLTMIKSNVGVPITTMTAFDLIVNDLADTLKADNPLFDHVRFKAAVYGK